MNLTNCDLQHQAVPPSIGDDEIAAPTQYKQSKTPVFGEPHRFFNIVHVLSACKKFRGSADP
jgi:hypothetical protein